MLVNCQHPTGKPCGELILVHGLEGSSDAGYAKSMSYAALEAGYITHRFNLRSCGGTESLALSNYHSGQTSDVLHVIRERGSMLERLCRFISRGFLWAAMFR